MSIINDILDFSKIEAGKGQIDSCLFNVRKLVQSTCALYSESAHRKKLKLLQTVDDAVPGYLIGDPVRIQQILNNLVSNALKFTHVGHVVIKISALHKTESTVTMNCSVTDTGIGITEEALRCLFQPFTQADGSTTRNYGGSGLGLFISRQLAECMGGNLQVRSEFGYGTTFWFRLPLMIPSAAAIAEFSADPCSDERPAFASDALAGDMPDLKTLSVTRREVLKEGATVLLVEDNEVNQQRLHKEIAIMMLTVNQERAAIKESITLGACDYVIKPLNIPMLKDRLEKLIERHNKRTITYLMDQF